MIDTEITLGPGQQRTLYYRSESVVDFISAMVFNAYIRGALRKGKLKILSLLCGLIFAVPAFSQVAGPTDQELRDNRDKALNLVNTRRKLDQLVWGPELLAQQYEQRIVKLWDELLKAEQKFEVLAAFPFKTLTLAAHQKSEAVELGIARYKFDGAGQVWSHEQFKKFITDAAAGGYRLEQSEWHHASFQPLSLIHI